MSATKKRVIGAPITDIIEHIAFLDKSYEIPTTTGKVQLRGHELEFKFVEKKSDESLKQTAAEEDRNRPKNRYTNVLPPDDTRVILSTLPGKPGSDYINANYISGETEDCTNEYIATQGPLQHTVGDFWRMIYEQNSKIILMLTLEMENGKGKCVKYWPDEGSMVYDQTKVTMQSVEQLDQYLIARYFVIDNINIIGSEPRTIVQYQYLEWPDHSLPASSSVFLNLVHMVKREEGDGPIIVHCSAGIGRTGTFCVVHSIVKMLNKHVAEHQEMPPINVVSTVLHMRKQRPGMVQTHDQYMFCYTAIGEEYLKLKMSLAPPS